METRQPQTASVPRSVHAKNHRSLHLHAAYHLSLAASPRRPRHMPVRSALASLETFSAWSGLLADHTSYSASRPVVLKCAAKGGGERSHCFIISSFLGKTTRVCCCCLGLCRAEMPESDGRRDVAGPSPPIMRPRAGWTLTAKPRRCKRLLPLEGQGQRHKQQKKRMET